ALQLWTARTSARKAHARPPPWRREPRGAQPERFRHAARRRGADRLRAPPEPPGHAPVDPEPEIADVEPVPLAGWRARHLVEQVVRHEAPQKARRRSVIRVLGEALLFPRHEPRDAPV